MSIFGTTSGTIDGRGQSRLAACLSGAFCPFRLGGRRLHLKKQKSLENPSLSGAGSFAGAEMRPDKERPAENTYCIVKGLDAVWAHFCPSKPCLPLSSDGKDTKCRLKWME